MRTGKPPNTQIPSKREANTEGKNLRDEDYIIRKGLSYSAETIKLSETKMLLTGKVNGCPFLLFYPSVSQRDDDKGEINCKERNKLCFLGTFEQSWVNLWP